MKLINLIVKRIFDFFLAIFFLVLFSIPIIVIIFVIYFYDGGPAFFVQERAGVKGKKIKVIKFKTIIKTSSKKKEVTKLGKFLRITRIDEIPQILNVLKGDLSFVGPRPLFLEYTKLYSNYQKKRLDVKPGITGWAQINGDNNISWKKKFSLDIWYVKNFNIVIDIKILFLTIVFFIKSILFYNEIKYKKIIIDKKFNGKN
jgi:undecaprenyl phosphate N,N'-diacetylbacillosamine 1-phosphate transferase